MRLATAASPTGFKRSRLDRATRREQLLDAAAQIFVVRGFHAAGMDEISERAGVSKPVLYQHFPGKLELYLAVLERYVEQLSSTVRGALESTHSNHDRLRAAIAAYFDFVDHDVAGYRLVFESDALDEPLVHSRVEHALETCVDAIYDLVAQDSGLEPYHARIVAVGLAGIGQSSARYWLEADRPIPKDEAVDATVALAWGGLAHVPLSPQTRG